MLSKKQLRQLLASLRDRWSHNLDSEKSCLTEILSFIKGQLPRLPLFMLGAPGIGVEVTP
jgi:hypothetical protein